MGDDHRSKISLDVQRVKVPDWGYGNWYRAGFYLGAGVEGRAVDDGSREKYFIRAPIGAAVNFIQLEYFEPTAFIELAPQFGYPNLKFDRRNLPIFGERGE